MSVGFVTSPFLALFFAIYKLTLANKSFYFFKEGMSLFIIIPFGNLLYFAEFAVEVLLLDILDGREDVVVLIFALLISFLENGSLLILGN